MGVGGRKSVIRHHPHRAEIEELILSKRGAEFISAKYGVSASTVRRWKAKLVIGMPIDEDLAVAPADFIARLARIADSMWEVRERAARVGDATAVVRAGTAEAQVLKDLLDRLGIADDDAMRSVEEAAHMGRAVAQLLVKIGPQAARDFVQLLRDASAPQSLIEGAERLVQRAHEEADNTSEQETGNE